MAIRGNGERTIVDIDQIIAEEKEKAIQVARTRGAEASHALAKRSPETIASEAHWQTWIPRTMGRYFSQEMGWFHKAFWDKVWAVEEDKAPKPLLLPWSRFFGKSQSVRALTIALHARQKRKYVLYFSGIQKQADKHVVNIGRMLNTTQIRNYYPELANPQVNELTGSKVAWNRTQLITQSGLIIESMGVESAARGVNFDEFRPDILIIDDIDEAKDSWLEVEKKIELLGASILPAGQENTWVVFAQNPIHIGSVMSKIMDSTAEILIDHDIIGPVPAFQDYHYERKAISQGKEVYRITRAKLSWSGFTRERGETELNKSGLARFEREYQHNMHIAVEGAIYPGYSPIHHIVTWKEVAAGFLRASRGDINMFHLHSDRCPDDCEQRYDLPFHWEKGLGMDWGTTPAHPTGLKWMARSAEFEPFNDIWLWYREVCLPKFPRKAGDVVEPVSPIQICKLIRRLEKPWREDENMETRVMSHEQSAAHATFVHDEPEFSEYEGLAFRKRKGDARSGIAQMQNRFNLDMTREHPFRVFPEGYWVDDVDLSGKPLMGYPYQIHIVADNQGALYVDSNGKLCQQAAIDDAGMVRSRWERPRYRNVTSQDGKEQNKPYALGNDICDAERYLAEEFGVSVQEAPLHAKVQRRIDEINPGLSLEELFKKQERDRGEAQAAWAAHDNLADRIAADIGEGDYVESALVSRRRAMDGQRMTPKQKTLAEFNRRHGAR